MVKKSAKFKQNDWVLLFSRIFLTTIFLLVGYNHLMDPVGTKAFMASAGLFAVDFLYIVAVLFMFIGGLSVLLGYRTDLGAVLLMMFLIPSTLIFHLDFSNMDQIINFQKNLAILGGLFAIYVAGPGRISEDKK